MIIRFKSSQLGCISTVGRSLGAQSIKLSLQPVKIRFSWHFSSRAELQRRVIGKKRIPIRDRPTILRFQHSSKPQLFETSNCRYPTTLDLRFTVWVKWATFSSKDDARRGKLQNNCQVILNTLPGQSQSPYIPLHRCDTFASLKYLAQSAMWS